MLGVALEMESQTQKKMNGLKISFAVVAFVLVKGIGVIWYISKLDSRVDQMYKSFEEENKKDVIENQVKMKLDLENIIADVQELRKVVKKLKSKDQILINQNEVITEDHQRLFEILENSSSNTSGYSYGD